MLMSNFFFLRKRKMVYNLFILFPSYKFINLRQFICCIDVPRNLCSYIYYIFSTNWASKVFPQPVVHTIQMENVFANRKNST